ncbi:MAG: DUF938 domain-containing protein [Alphaproteobacteria bacterium]|nr:MAG: DUF938 domain-containing protein [Alphaproteobacteria bacterium]
MSDPRLYAPAVQRNREPLRDVLAEVLPASGLVLEVASGTGEHAVFFAEAFPGLTFQPTDADAEARASIDAWVALTGQGNLRPALALDAAAAEWPITAADAVMCINMIHIAPWAACLGLMAGAARCLSPSSPLILYGPYRRDGQHTAPSNVEFDRSLKARNSAWGVRDLEAVAAAAAAVGFAPPIITAMPANNFTLVFRRS